MGTVIQEIGHGNAAPDPAARSCRPRSLSDLIRCKPCRNSNEKKEVGAQTFYQSHLAHIS